VLGFELDAMIIFANLLVLPLEPLCRLDGDVLLNDIPRVGHDHKGCCRYKAYEGLLEYQVGY